MPIRVQAPDGKIVEFPDDTSMDTMKSAMAKAFPPQKEDQGMLETLGSSFKKGLEELGPTFTKAIPAEAKALVGDEKGSREKLNEYHKAIQDIENKYPEVPEGFGHFSAALLGQGIASMGPTLGAAALGGFAAGPLGAIAGGLATGLAMNSPETFVGVMEATNNRDPHKAAEVALGVGALKSGLDFAGPGRVIGKLGGEAGKHLLTSKILSKAGFQEAAKLVGTEALKTASIEGLTEATQEALDVASEKIMNNMPKEFFSKDSLYRMAVNGYAGALTGGLVGGVEGGINAARSDVELSKAQGKAFQNNTTVSKPGKGTLTITPKGLSDDEILKEEVVNLSDILPEPEEFLKGKPEKAKDILKDLKYDPNNFHKSQLPLAATLAVNNALKTPKVSSVEGFLDSASKVPHLSKTPLIDSDILESIKTPGDLQAVSKVLRGSPQTPLFQKQMPKNNNITWMTPETGFRSALKETVASKLQGKGSGEQMLGTLRNLQKNGHFKAEELEWSGLEEYLKDRPNVSKQEVQDFLDKGGVQVRKIEVGTDLAKHKDSYTLEGPDTKNYREYGYALPITDQNEIFTRTHLGNYNNIFAHRRASDMVINGVNTNVLQEAQSDWHQTGEEVGYRTKDYKSAKQKLGEFFDSLNAKYGANYFSKMTDQERDRLDILKETSRIESLTHERPPNAPFKTTWDDLILKDHLLETAKEGYGQMAIPKTAFVEKVQGHDRPGHFYENRLKNKLKALAKKYGLILEDANVEISSESDINRFPEWVREIDPDNYVAYGQYMGNAFPEFFEQALARVSSSLEPNYEMSMQHFEVKLQNALDLKIKKAIDEYLNNLSPDGLEKISSAWKGVKAPTKEQISKNMFNDWVEEAHINIRPPIKELLNPTKDKYSVTIVKMTPEARQRILGEGMTLMQRPAYIYQDHMKFLGKDSPVWTFSEDTVRGIHIPFTQKSALMNGLEKIAKDIAGGTFQTAWLKELHVITNEETSKLRGATIPDYLRQVQGMNVIAVSIEDNPNIAETMLHEVWHHLYDYEMGFFEDSERKLIDSSVTEMAEHLAKHYGISAADILQNYHGDAQTAKVEIIAHLFGLWASDRLLGKTPRITPRGAFAKVFEKALQFLKRVKNYLKGNGFSTYEDVFKKVLEGKARIDSPRERLMQNNHIFRQEHITRVGEEVRASTRAYLDDLDMRYISQEVIKDYDSYKGMNLYGKTLSTATYHAHNNPFMAVALSLKQGWEEMNTSLVTRFVTKGQAYNTQKSDAVKVRAAEILDHLRNTDQPLTVNEDGSVSFIRGSQGVTIRHPEMVQVLTSLDAMLKEPLEVREDILWKLLKQYVPNADRDKTPLSSIEKYLATDPMETEEEQEDALSVIKAIKGIRAAKTSGYMPHMRFGPYAITVHLNSSLNPNGTIKEGEKPIYHAHLEEGNYKGKYDPLQYKITQKEIEEELKKRGLPKSAVRISSPYKVTHDSLYNALANQMYTFEMLTALLGSTKDPETYDQIMQQFEKKIKVKGFARHFLESDNIAGYSKDWRRAIPAYLTGSASHIARNAWKPKLDSLGRLIDSKLGKTRQDKGVKDYTKNYIDRVTSPSDQWQALATVNFMWTMGFNVSSAAMQLVGLPTFTLGNMSKYNPNMFENAGTIAKNFSLLLKKIMFDNRGMIDIENGAAIVRFDNEDFLDSLAVSDKMKKYIKDFFMSGKGGAQFIEEQIGQKGFESRTLKGKSKTFTEIIKNYSAIPMSLMEQITRMTTAMSTFETLEKHPEAIANAKRILENDMKYKYAKKIFHGQPEIEILSNHVVDETHAVFGRTGRGPLYEGFGRVALPFTQYPMSMNEAMVRMAKQGPEGRRALAITLASLMLFGGLLAVPGAELLKELIETLINQLKGENIDLEAELRMAMTEMTGSDIPGKLITQGLPRASGLDISGRIRQPIAGQDLLLAVIGAKGDVSSMAGVQGSMARNAIEAFKAYRDGDTGAKIAGYITPTALSNLFKAWNMTSQGVQTNKDTMLLTPEYIDKHPSEAWWRAFGFSTDAVASAREEQYWSSLENTKTKPRMDSFRSEGKAILSAIARYNKQGNQAKAEEYRDKWRDLQKRVSKYVVKNNMGFDSIKSYNRSVFDAVPQRLKGGVPIKEYNKDVRGKAKIISEASGANKLRE